MAPPTVPIFDRFRAKYRVDESTGCWIWTAALMPNGYAQFRYSRAKNGYGHRFAYEHYKGSIPDGKQIDHLCKVKACVNPDHLEIVVAKENIRRIGPRRSANREKTHCKHGHPLVGDNVYRTPIGGRVCKTCRRESGKQWYHQKGRAKRRSAKPAPS